MTEEQYINRKKQEIREIEQELSDIDRQFKHKKLSDEQERRLYNRVESLQMQLEKCQWDLEI